MTPIEYSIHLSTGEWILIAELDPDKNGPLTGAVLQPFLERCSRVTRVAIEEAKMGHTKPLEQLLRTPPVGSLLKVQEPACSDRSECVMADPKKCSLRNISKKGGKFPVCWTSGDEISTYIAHAWRQGMYVLIVD